MTDDIFSERRRALEESFYAKKNQELLAKLRAGYSNQQKKEQLSVLSGIQDSAVLDQLLALGVNPESFAALSLVPLVLLAWSDDFLDPRERHQILKAAETDGVDPGEPAYALIKSWLDERPDPRLLDHWKSYVGALKGQLPPESLAKLRDQLLGRARRVAHAAGGMFGLGSVAAVEKSLLDQLETAFA